MGEEIKILAEGLSAVRCEYKDIELNLTRNEKTRTSKTPLTYSIETYNKNSAEVYNFNLRNRHKVVAYDVSDINRIYRTKTFKIYKYTSVISVSKYLTDVSELILLINEQLYKIDSKFRPDELSAADNQAASGTKTAAALFGLLNEIRAHIDDLINNRHSINLDSAYSELNTSIRIILSTSKVPKEICPGIDCLFPKISLVKFSGKEKKDSSYFTKSIFIFNEKIKSSLQEFLSKLIHQFYFYVTPPTFLNNPDYSALFVVSLCMYKKFNFHQSGLSYDERIDIFQTAGADSVYSVIGKFYTEVRDCFSSVCEKAGHELCNTENLTDDFSLEEFVKEFHKFNCGKKSDKIDRLEVLFEDPRILEKASDLIMTTRFYIKEGIDRGMNPWESDFPEEFSPDDMKKRDIDTAYFIYQIHLRFVASRAIPQTQWCNFLNLFSYTNLPLKRLNSHIKNFQDGKIPEHWCDSDFLTVLEK